MCDDISGQVLYRLSARASSNKAESMKQSRFPKGWNEDRVKRILAHYESRSEEEAIAENKAAWDDPSQTFMEIPNDLVPIVRELLAKRAEKALNKAENQEKH